MSSENTVIILKIKLLNAHYKNHQVSTECNSFKSNVKSLQQENSELQNTVNKCDYSHVSAEELQVQQSLSSILNCQPQKSTEQIDNSFAAFITPPSPT